MNEQLSLSVVPSEEIRHSAEWISRLSPVVRGFEDATASPERMLEIMLQRASLGNVFIVAENLEGTPVGLLGLEHYDNDPRGAEFYEELSRSNPQIAQALLTDRRAYHVNPIVVAPGQKGNGVGKQLMQKMWNELQPSFLSGFTKNPIQAMNRTTTAGEASYITYLGKTNITDGTEEGKPIPDGIYDAYLSCLRTMNTLYARDGFLYLVQDTAGGNLPSVEGFPPVLQEAFRPLIEEQRRQQALPDGKTVLLPLISIPERLVDAWSNSS